MGAMNGALAQQDRLQQEARGRWSPETGIFGVAGNQPWHFWGKNGKHQFQVSGGNLLVHLVHTLGEFPSPFAEGLRFLGLFRVLSHANFWHYFLIFFAWLLALGVNHKPGKKSDDIGLLVELSERLLCLKPTKIWSCNMILLIW